MADTAPPSDTTTAQAQQLGADILAELEHAVADIAPAGSPSVTDDIAASTDNARHLVEETIRKMDAIRDAYLSWHARKQEELRQKATQSQIDQIKARLTG